jgi:hypothetical protein
MLKEVVDFLLIRSKFSPDMFRHMVAILRGSWVPYKLPKRCSVLWMCADCAPSRVASCYGTQNTKAMLQPIYLTPCTSNTYKWADRWVSPPIKWGSASCFCLSTSFTCINRCNKIATSWKINFNKNWKKKRLTQQIDIKLNVNNSQNTFHTMDITLLSLWLWKKCHKISHKKKIFCAL